MAKLQQDWSKTPRFYQLKVVFRYDERAAGAIRSPGFGPTDEIYGGLGTRFVKGWLTNDGRTVTTWAETNVWHQFGDDAQTTFANLQGTSPATFAASLGGTWAQLGLGISGQITRNVSIFGNADYNLALNQPGHSAGGRAGFKVAW